MIVHGVTPILNVSDFRASVAWFESLGWTKRFEWGEPPGFGAVGSGKVEIFLCEDGQGGRGRGPNARTFGEPEDERMDKGAWMTLWVEDVDAVHRECLANAVEVTFPPTDMPWNVREMHIRHLDGHVFRVSRGFDER